MEFTIDPWHESFEFRKADEIWKKKYVLQAQLRREPDWWPVDRLENTFLPRAVRTLGARIHSESWINLNFDCLKALAWLHNDLKEGTVSAGWDSHADLPSLYSLSCAYAEIDPRFQKPSYPDDYSFDLLENAIGSLFQYLAGPMSLYRRIENELVDSMCNGWVTGYSRAKSGGPFSRVDHEFWLRDSWSIQLRDGQDVPDDDFNLQESNFLFIKEFELKIIEDRITQKLGLKQERQIESAIVELSHSAAQEYASPYIRMMIEMTRELNLSAHNQPPIKTLENWIYNNWPRFLKEMPSRSTLIPYMATLAREPSSQAGARRKNTDPQK